MAEARFQYRREVADLNSRFDVLIATCGYESRASSVAKEHVTDVEHVFSYTYPNHRGHNFADNLQFFTLIGDVRHPSTAAEFAMELRDDLSAVVKPGARMRVAVDISSFDRERLGSVVRVLEELGGINEVSVSFVYALASFDSHAEDVDTTILVNGPLEGFEGWTGNPSSPVACVMGLGFENLVALAALETLEPSRTIAFIPQSDDDRFHERVRRDNASLIGSVPGDLVPYDLDSPFDALHGVEGVVHALLDDYRVALVPLGPKLFALCCLLVAREYRDRVAIWRVSADQGGEVEDRSPTGRVSTLEVLVTPA